MNIRQTPLEEAVRTYGRSKDCVSHRDIAKLDSVGPTFTRRIDYTANGHCLVGYHRHVSVTRTQNFSTEVNAKQKKGTFEEMLSLQTGSRVFVVEKQKDRVTYTVMALDGGEEAAYHTARTAKELLSLFNGAKKSLVPQNT